MKAPKKCPACGSKRNWVRITDQYGRAESKGKRRLQKAALSTVGVPPIPGVQKKVLRAVTNTRGTYYCKKCGFKQEYVE